MQKNERINCKYLFFAAKQKQDIGTFCAGYTLCARCISLLASSCRGFADFTKPSCYSDCRFF